MVDKEIINSFAEDLRQKVIAKSQMVGGHAGSFRENEFTRICIDYLAEAGELEDGEVCYHSGPDIKVNGYHLYEDGTRLDLFISFLTQVAPPISIKRNEIKEYFFKLRKFLEQSYDGYYKSLEEASCAFDMAQLIYKNRKTLKRIRLFLFTDALTALKKKNSSIEKKTGISSHLWDLGRLFSCSTSAQTQEFIEIDFQTSYGQAIPCLSMPDSNSDYNACLLIIPGKVLYSLYLDHGPRLLERNVRTYLQARGKINKGIRQTILKEPHRFLSYNNGISATAETAEFVDLPGGGQGLID